MERIQIKNKNKQPFQTTLLLSSLLVAAVAAFSAHAAVSPGYVYDSAGNVMRDSYGDCLRSSLWSKENATRDCNPELFPAPKIAVPAPAPTPAPRAAPRPALTPAPTPAPKPNALTLEVLPELAPAPKVVAPSPKEMVFAAAALFDFDKAVLTPAGQQKIREHREQVKAELRTATVVKITGHTDSIGSADYNQQLSLRRAQAVRDYLITLGDDAGKMQVAGKGEIDPLSDNNTAAGRAKNRRVHVEVIGFGK